MKINRTKNAAKGIAVGTFLKIYQMILPFVMRTIMIYFLGVQYLGLNSLFTSILQVLNLAELGVGNAMVFSMYRPIAEDDKKTICALMKLYRKYYRIIGLVIGVIGGVLTPFVPFLIKNKSVPDDMNIYVLYLLNLAATVLTYWLFAYKNSLLVAHQRTDVKHAIMIATNTLQYALQIFVVIILKNYYAYVIMLLASQVVNNISTAAVVNKMYPEYVPEGELPKEQRDSITQRIKDLFTSKVGFVITNSADTIVISAFLGLEALAIYQNYYFILTSIIGLIEIVFSSTLAGIGNSFILESQERNFNIFRRFTFMICWIAGMCSACFLGLFQPFMRIWVGEALTLEYGCVICFVLYFYFYELNRVLNVFKDAAGLWHEDRFRPLTVALVNLCINLMLVKFWGLYGVLLSTVFATVFVGMPWICHNIFTNLFDAKYLFGYLKNLLIYVIAAVAVCVSSVYLCDLVKADGLVGLIIRLCICVVVSNVIFFILFRKKKEFRDSLKMLNKATGNKLKLAK